MWQQHHPKQGALLRMAPYNSLNANHIGDESLLQYIMKMTAPCLTCCIYRYPPLANKAWVSWRNLEQHESIIDTLLTNSPRDWRKYPEISYIIVKACPFLEFYI
jgi:hypothetical protein